MKSAGQDKPRTQVPERWLQNPALSIGPDVLKPIVGGMSPCKPQVSLLQSSLGAVKAKHQLTQNPPVDLEPWIRAVQLPLLTPPFPNGFQQALTISKLRADSGARCTAMSSLPTYKSSPRLGQPSALRHSKASTEPTAHCRERNPKSGSESICKRRRGGMRGWGGEEGKK